VCLQALVLRESGYRCEHAELYYAGTRQRVRVELTAARISWVRDVVADARGVADAASPPLPLVDSPKCVRCSLVGLCLPDETNALLARRSRRCGPSLSPTRLIRRSTFAPLGCGPRNRYHHRRSRPPKTPKGRNVSPDQEGIETAKGGHGLRVWCSIRGPATGPNRSCAGMLAHVM